VTTIFETERLIIREWTESPADLDRVLDIYSRMEVGRWLGMTKPMETLDQARAAVQRWSARYGTPHGCWAVEVRATGVVAGTVLLQPFPDATEVEVGWHLHPDSWGYGYATEAGRAAVEHGFAHGLDEIYAIAYPDNEPSLAVMRRIGMSPIGRTTRWYQRESECYLVRALDSQS
jgi:RimJ/RimL family protein N-acetyltransferase